MAMNYRVITGAAIGAGLIGLMGAATVSAANNTSDTTLANKLATTFHLNQADVQKVLDQDRTEHQAQRAADQKARLDGAVKAGTITAEQEKLIIAKQAELQAVRDKNHDTNADRTTRQTAMKAERDALKKWADDNKIPMNLLMPGHGPGMHGGPGRPDGDTPLSS